MSVLNWKNATLDTSKRHARLGPSSSDIWLTCESAPQTWLTAPPKQTSHAAKEGTLAHTLCEAAIILQNIPWAEGAKFEVDGDEIEVTPDMLNAVSLYTAYVSGLGDQALWVKVEREVSLSWLWAPNPAPEDVFGTADFLALVDTDLNVVDFKYGRGKAVKVEANPQLGCYGVGGFGLLQEVKPRLAARVKTVSFTIVQPRAGGNPIRKWSIPIAELLLWAKLSLKPAIDRISAGAPKGFVPGAHCWFCPSNMTCEHLHSLKVKAAMLDFPDFPPEDDNE